MELISGRLQIAHTAYYSLLKPATSTAAPLLIALHGYGQHADKFVKVFEPLAARGIYVAAPQAPHHFYINLARREVGFTWLTRYERDQGIRDFAAYMEQFYSMLIRDYPIEPEQIYVLGFSQGVSMAYRLWVHTSVPVQGLIACGADLPPDITTKLIQARPIRILLVHGRQDEVVPISKAHDAFAVLRHHDIQAEQFHFDGGHLVPPEALPLLAEMIRNNR